MVDQQIISYIKENISKGFTLEDIKVVLLKKGYSVAEVENAAMEAMRSSSIGGMKKPSPADHYKELGLKTSNNDGLIVFGLIAGVLMIMIVVLFVL